MITAMDMDGEVVSGTIIVDVEKLIVLVMYH